jgi:hypothetical protein
MALLCPSCNKLIFPLFASFGGTSECPHCKKKLTTPKVSKGFIFLCLIGIALGNTLEKFFKTWVSEEIAFFLVIATFVVGGVSIVKINVTQPQPIEQDKKA